MSADDPAHLVERLYLGLATGDRPAVAELLHPEFDGYFSPGLPPPIGGHHAGAEECIEQGWWAIGARWAVRAEPARWLPCGPHELLVTGSYRGRARRVLGMTGELDAPFAHLWTAEDGRLRTLHQYTDTALWRDTLEVSR